MKTYGLPYKGSKDKICSQICSLFPIKENFYDLFMGGGSTGVTCINTNRNFIGIELDDNYFKIAEDRINKTKENIFDM